MIFYSNFRTAVKRAVVKIIKSSNGLLRSAIEELRGRIVERFDGRIRSSFLRRAGGVVWQDELLDCAEQDDSLWQYGSTERICISHRQPIPEELAAVSGESAFSRPFVCAIEDARLLGPAAIGITEDGVMLETVESDKELLDHRIKDTFKQLGFMQTRRLLGKGHPDETYDLVFPLVRHRSVNYYHWVLEYLRKLRALELYQEQTGNDPTVLIARDQPRWVTESLKLAGYDPADLTRWSGGVASVDRLIIPEHRSGGAVSPSDCRWLRDRMTANADGSTNSNRIYVSRREADQRRVVNEEELLEALSSFGFEAYVLEQMSFEDQVSLFNDAELIVGPHGAGLVNMIFSADTTVVELLHGGDVRPHYFRLAKHLSYGYDFLVCDSRGEDMSVDVPAVRQRVKRTLQLRNDS